jgi:hypothetical protein
MVLAGLKLDRYYKRNNMIFMILTGEVNQVQNKTTIFFL